MFQNIPKKMEGNEGINKNAQPEGTVEIPSVFAGNPELASQWAAVQEQKKSNSEGATLQVESQNANLNPLEQAMIKDGQNKEVQQSQEEKTVPSTEQNIEEKTESTESTIDDPGKTNGPDSESSRSQEGSDNLITSELLGGNFDLESGKAIEAQNDFKTVDEVQSYLKQKHGIDDFKALEEKVSDWRSKEKELQAVSTSNQQLTDLFASLPSDLYNAIDAFTKQEDWRSQLSTMKVDYNKDISSYDKKTLVSAIIPDSELTDEDWEEYNDPDGDVNVKRAVSMAIRSAESLFSTKKEQIDNYAKSQVQKQKEYQDSFVNSVQKAKDSFLSSNYKNAPQNIVDDFEKTFTKTGIQNEFYDENGHLREDAFTKLAMARYGTELVDQLMVKKSRQVEEKVTQQFLERTPEKPPAQVGSQGVPQDKNISERAQKVLENIGLGKPTNYS